MTIAIIIVLLVIIIFLGEKTREYYIIEKQREYISFCVSAEDFSHNSDLLNVLNDNNKRYICEEEQDDFYFILHKYQDYMKRLFIRKELTRDKALLSVSRDDFFVETFGSFLNSHSTDLDFYGNRKAEYSHDINDFTKKYTLSPFGLTFYKALYATKNYCYNKGKTEKQTLDAIEKTLETKEVEIMRYRP